MNTMEHLAKILSECHFDELNPPQKQVARLDEAYEGIKGIICHKFSSPRKFKSDLLSNIVVDFSEIIGQSP